MNRKLKAKRVFVNPIYKDRAVVLKDLEETNGAYLLGELEIFPGGGNFMHTHSAFKETFTAVKGELGIALGKTKHYLQPGQSITVPLHTPHHFFNNSNEPVICHIHFSPGHAGFIKGIAIAYGLAADGRTTKKGTPKNIMHLALLMVLTDTKPTGLLGVLFPVFRRLAVLARKNGMEQALLEKYYYEQNEN